VRRECEFIEVNNKTFKGDPIRSIFVSSPTNFFGGWARHQWLKGYFGKECSCVSSDFWEMLVERHGQPKLLIEENGEFRIEEAKNE